MQRELLDRTTWDSRAQLASAMFEWIEGFYNPRRRHLLRLRCRHPTDSLPGRSSPQLRCPEKPGQLTSAVRARVGFLVSIGAAALADLSVTWVNFLLGIGASI